MLLTDEKSDGEVRYNIPMQSVPIALLIIAILYFMSTSSSKPKDKKDDKKEIKQRQLLIKVLQYLSNNLTISIKNIHIRLEVPNLIKTSNN